MKRIYRFVCAAFAIAAAAGCEKEQKVTDFPIQGELSISGKYVTYLHGYQGWIAEDEIGVFVTSDGVEQCNLQYVPSEYCPTVEGSGSLIYDTENYKNSDILLSPKGNAAGFKQGEHNIYAYVPYDKDNTDHTAIPLPKIDIQKYHPLTSPGRVMQYTNPEYDFAYAKLAEPINEYTSATLSLGEFTSPYLMMTIPCANFSDDFKDKTVTKVVISADVDIAVSDATINLETGEISGNFSKSVTYEIPDGLKIEYVEYMPGFGMNNMSTMYVVIYGNYEDAIKTEYTITYTIDGQEYTTKATPGNMQIAEGNINMAGVISFE